MPKKEDALKRMVLDDKEITMYVLNEEQEGCFEENLLAVMRTYTCILNNYEPKIVGSTFAMFGDVLSILLGQSMYLLESVEFAGLFPRDDDMIIGMRHIIPKDVGEIQFPIVGGGNVSGWATRFKWVKNNTHAVVIIGWIVIPYSTIMSDIEVQPIFHKREGPIFLLPIPYSLPSDMGIVDQMPIPPPKFMELPIAISLRPKGKRTKINVRAPPEAKFQLIPVGVTYGRGSYLVKEG